MTRTFIAIELPHGIKKEIAGFQENIASSGFPVRWIPVKNIHITLKFIGEIPESLVQQIERDILTSPPMCEPFTVKIGGTGVFPNLKRPRIFWVGIAAGGHEIQLLSSALEEQLFSLGIPKEERKFRAHITIGRFRHQRHMKTIQEFVSQNILNAGEFQVEKIVLMKSTLRPSGAEYSVVKEHSLLE